MSKTKKQNNNRNTKTKKNHISGKIIHNNQEGWKVIHIYGTDYERGYAHGVLLVKDLHRVCKSFPFIIKEQFEIPFKKYLKVCKTIISPIIKSQYQEIYSELQGISDGSTKAGCKISVDYLIAWNSILGMVEYFENNDESKKPKLQRCSAFIATGDATKTGEIVMAHNTHGDMVSNSFFNIQMYVTPEKGFAFVMQTAAGFVASGTDWFVSASGIIGCETTISEINYTPQFGKGGGHPYFCRIRNAMQYGENLDDYVKYMTENNAGDYANSWLFGDIRSNEIMLCEIGLKVNNIQRTKNGLYYGMNSATSFKLRNEETTDMEYNDMNTSSGARNVRLDSLLNMKYYGKIDTKIAKEIISDHYDVNINTIEPNSHSICIHTYEDEREENYPHKCGDGKVVDSTMAYKMSFLARWGSSCGTHFNVKKYIKKNPEYKEWEKHLIDLPTREWVKI
jgi:hypothetical protein